MDDLSPLTYPQIGQHTRERVIDGDPHVDVWFASLPIVPGKCCNPGEHCCAHASEPYPCCRCGATFTTTRPQKGK